MLLSARYGRTDGERPERFGGENALFGVENIAAAGPGASHPGGDSGDWVERFDRRIRAKSERDTSVKR